MGVEEKEKPMKNSGTEEVARFSKQHHQQRCAGADLAPVVARGLAWPQDTGSGDSSQLTIHLSHLHLGWRGTGL